MTWLMANGGTIIVLAVLILIVALIVRKLHADKKKGIHSWRRSLRRRLPGCSSCGGSCSSCSAHKK